MTAIEIAKKVLETHGYGEWSIRVTESGGASCHTASREIWIDQHSQDDIFLLLHEIAHIKYPDHDRRWADRFTCLCQRHIGWAIPMGNWSDEVTLAMPSDVPRMSRLKREWLANLEGWIDWNKAPGYTKDHYEHNLDMVGEEGGKQ